MMPNKIYVSVTYSLNYNPDEMETAEISFTETKAQSSAAGGY